MSAPLVQPVSLRPRRGRPPTPGLRDRILRAAEAIFARHDYHEVQMDDVVEACGVGKGTLYRYFPSKQQLYFAVTFDGIQRLRGELEAAVGTREPPAQNIHRIVHRTLAFFWHRRVFFSVMHRREHKATCDAREGPRYRTARSPGPPQPREAAVAAGLH